MALILKDRVKESSSSSGTGSITLGGAISGYQTFNAAIATGSTVYYTIHNLTAGDDDEWEVGVGTFTSPSTLSRDTVLSSSTGSKVNFTAGASGLEVFITQPAGEAVYINQATNKVEAFGNGANTITFTNINTTNLTATTVTLTNGTISTNAANATDITNKTYVDGLFSQGISYHEAVLVESPVTAGNLDTVYVQPNGASNGVGATLTNNAANVALVIDGISVSNTARVLIYSQSNAVQNGVYTVTNPGAPDSPGPGVKWVLTRATDADTYGLANPNTLGAGDAFFVQDGNTGAGETYVCNTQGTITFGSSNITFAQISSAQIYDAGTGLNLANLTFSIANTAVTAAQYGNDGAVGQFTVNAQGQLTNAANVSINASSITVGTLANARTTADSANGASTIVSRDSSGGINVGALAVTGAATFSTSVTMSTAGGNVSIGTSGTTGVTTIGGTATTSILTVGRSTANQTTNIQAGATLSGNTKTINLGTNGVSGSTTVINIGDANGTTVTVNGTTNLANVNVSGNVSAGGSISGNGASLSAINASNISSGTIDNSRTTAASANGAATIVLRDSSGSFSAGDITANSISGNGVSLTAINASNIATGTIANARTTAATANGASTIVLRGSSGEFSAGTITGTFSGDGSAVSSINASNLSSGTVATARLASGTANSTTYLRGDQTWAVVSGGTLIPSGTVMLFAQTSAPTGFTKNTTTGDNSALRVTTGTASTGGSVGFTTAFASQTPTGSVSITAVSGSAGATTLTTPQIPSHTHTVPQTQGYNYTPNTSARGNVLAGGAPNLTTGSTGGGGSHTHPFSFTSGSGTFTGNAINLAVQYIDVIRATKD